MSEPNKIRVMADEAAATIVRLSAERDAAETKGERAALNKRLRNVRQLERWMRTRAGYA